MIRGATEANGYETVMPTYAPAAITFERGEGSWCFDAKGRAYLDCIAGIAVCSLGHAHPEVAAAIAEQASTLVHVSNLFANPLQPQLASVLDERLGGGGRVFFCNSGAEANEAALKLARRWGAPRQASVVVSAQRSFHGRTFGALSVTGQPAKREPFAPLVPGMRFVPFGDADALADAVRPDVAAVLLEPIQGEGGVFPAPEGYLAAVRAACDRVGALLMLDEVQTGLGRTGTWFAHHHDGVRPDVVCMAKALGNGMPIGALWAHGAAGVTLQPGEHGTTFGGQPLATRAALTVLEVMAREDVCARATARGTQLQRGLASLPGVVEVRGRGLLCAAELAPGVDARSVTRLALDHGLILNAVTPTALRFAPSLLITEHEVDSALERLATVLKESA